MSSSHEGRDTWRPTSSVPPRDRAKGGLTEEKRKGPRKRLRHAVEFALDDGQRCSGVCRNLGLGGAQILTADPAPFGARITIFMELEGIDGQSMLTATVRWSKPGTMGIQFDPHGVRVTHALLGMMRDEDG